MITNHTPPESMARSNHALKAVLLIGLVAGTLDITAAILVSGAGPLIVLKFIASGAFGRDTAFSGGLSMAFLGLVFHYVIAYSWTVLYFFLYPRVSILSKNRIISGLAYGIVVWIAMNFVVIPLSQIPARPFDPTQAVIGCAVLMVAIGLPISIMTHRHYSKRNSF
jgi:hypothetical protein